MNNYDDIINLNRPISKHQHLGIDSRSAQFAPFAALVGYDEAVKETARLTKRKIELNDELKEKHKKVMAALGRTAKVQPSDNQLSGIGLATTRAKEVTFKVVANNEEKIYKVIV